MSTATRSPVRELASIPVDILGISMANLVSVLADPYSQEVVEAKCNHCDAVLSCRRIVAPFVACDACREKHFHDEKMKRYQKYWESVCPERFRQTDLKHADFPSTLYKDLAEWQRENPTGSLFLYGPTGTAKTRTAMLLLKRALLRDQRVAVLWPEKLRTLTGFDNGSFDLYAGYDVLLLDDCLLTACREAKLVDALKQLIDVRMRHNRPFLVTSQIGTEEDVRDGKEFGEAKSADIERIRALLRRLREECKVVSFAPVTPAAGQEAF